MIKKFKVTYVKEYGCDWCNDEWIGKVFEFDGHGDNWTGPIINGKNAGFSWGLSWLEEVPNLNLKDFDETIQYVIQKLLGEK